MTDALALENITMRFGNRTVLDHVDFRVVKGSIHGLIGENGAGKSTLMNVAAGLLRPTEGRVLLNGAPYNWKSPGEAIKQGIGMVHQHFMLAAPYTVLENVLLGQETTRSWPPLLPSFLRPLQKQQARIALNDLAKQYDLVLDMDARVSDLSVGEQQKVEILKVLYKKADILILDEPTAVLTPQETRMLFTQLRRLRQEGKTIIIITHKLREVMEVTDEVTVLRAGKVTAHVKTAETSARELATYMVGHDMIKPQAQRREPGETILSLRASSDQKNADTDVRLQDVKLDLRCGEIVGIAGVSGNGQHELLDLLMHPRQHFFHDVRGSLQWAGEDVSRCSQEQLRQRGLAVIYPDRQREGVCLDLDLQDNFILGYETSPRFSRGGWLNSDAITTQTQEALNTYDVRPAYPLALMRSLSGGNQQKLVVGRELSNHPKVLVAAEPTRGVDVGAVIMIHELFLRLRDQGGAVLLMSSDLEEVMALADRIIVIFQGRFVREFNRSAVTEEALGLAMGGHA